MNNDLISRSALRAEAIEMEIFQPYGGDGSCMGVTVGTIDCAPAVDAEPVRHGVWLSMTVSSGRESWQCSECGRRARGKRENLPYCHCGAKMMEVEG